MRPRDYLLKVFHQVGDLAVATLRKINPQIGEFGIFGLETESSRLVRTHYDDVQERVRKLRLAQRHLEDGDRFIKTNSQTAISQRSALRP